MNYITTEEQCRASISGVCPGCGGALTPIETVDNANRPTFWSGCQTCSRFTSGVDQEVFRIASQLFDDGERPYRHYDESKFKTPEEMAYYRAAQTNGLSLTVRRVLALHESTLRASLDRAVEDRYRLELSIRQFDIAINRIALAVQRFVRSPRRAGWIPMQWITCPASGRPKPPSPPTAAGWWRRCGR